MSACSTKCTCDLIESEISKTRRIFVSKKLTQDMALPFFFYYRHTQNLITFPSKHLKTWHVNNTNKSIYCSCVWEHFFCVCEMECCCATGSPNVKITHFSKLPLVTKTKLLFFKDPLSSFLYTLLWNSYCKRKCSFLHYVHAYLSFQRGDYPVHMRSIFIPVLNK